MRTTRESSRSTPASASFEASRQPSNHGKWAVFAVLAIGIFMAMLDSSIVVMTLPAIARSFGVGLTGTVEWVEIAYLVVVAATLPTVGRLVDMLGHKSIFLAGLVIFTLGSILCGVAPGLGTLVGFRAIEGLGGAILIALGPAMLTSAFPASERGRAMGLYILVISAGIIAGPIIGGLLLRVFVWRAIFFVNVPLGIIGLIAAARVLRRRSVRGAGRFDPIGAILLALGLAAVTLGLSFGQSWGWGSNRTIAVLATGVTSLAAMVAAELHLPDPILDLSLFRNRLFASTALTLVLSFVALFAVGFLMPFYLEELRGYSVFRSALLLTPFPLCIAVVAPLSGSLADRFGTRWLQVFGLIVVCAGLLLIGGLNQTTPLWQVMAALVVTGLGRGLFSSPNTSALMGAAPPERQGVASGIFATGQTAGQSISVALTGAVFAAAGAAAAGARLGQALTQPAALSSPTVARLQHTFVHGFHLAFLGCAGFAAIAVLSALIREAEEPAIEQVDEATLSVSLRAAAGRDR